jgi:hypothetical protein
MSHAGYLFVLHPVNREEFWVTGTNIPPGELAERLSPLRGLADGYLIVHASPVSDFMSAEKDLVDLLSFYRKDQHSAVFNCPRRDAIAACRAVAGRHRMPAPEPDSCGACRPSTKEAPKP